MRTVISFLTILFLSGCSFMQTDPLPTPEPVIKTVTEYKTLEIYQPQLPRKIDLQDVEFFVVTEKNLEEQIARIGKMQGGTFVIFGMIIPSTPASKTCLHISIFLFGNLTKVALFLISATLKRFGKSLLSFCINSFE